MIEKNKTRGFKFVTAVCFCDYKSTNHKYQIETFLWKYLRFEEKIFGWTNIYVGTSYVCLYVHYNVML